MSRQCFRFKLAAMSDGWVWLRCLGCKAVVRMVTANSAGMWGLWNGVDEFLAAHSTEACHPDHYWNMSASEQGYPFFEIVTEKTADEQGGINKPLDDLQASSGAT